MLFIDDNNPGIFHRREYCGSGAEKNRRFSSRCLSPGLEPFLICEARMHHCHFHIEAIAKTSFSLRGQANLGNHH